LRFDRIADRLYMISSINSAENLARKMDSCTGLTAGTTLGGKKKECIDSLVLDICFTRVDSASFLMYAAEEKVYMAASEMGPPARLRRVLKCT
jgi:hypothetical protein